jgi:23S rRNA (uridine2552-2'-O)-methyltransferase
MKPSPIKKTPQKPPGGKKNRFSKKWMREHVSDPFVQLAQKDGYRSRAAYKLLEIDAKDRLLKPGTVVVDLGAAPGGWSQVAAAKVGRSGKVIALDLLPMDPLAGVDFIQGDFREDAVLKQLEELLQGKAVGLVISDMAPNISGVASADQARAMHLAELAMEFALEHLKPDGSFLVKVFQGTGFEEFLKLMRSRFARVVTRKPKASRDRSSEVYLLGSGKLE